MLFDLFSDFFDDSDLEFFISGPKQVVSDRACPVCKTYLSEISKNGKAGCSNCYTEFEKEFDSILKSIHSSSSHTGKACRSADKKIKIKKEKEELSQKMQEAIEKQDFEQAAVIRDKLKALDKEGENK